MNILWCTIDRSTRVAGHFDMLQEAVAGLVDVTFIRKSTEGLLAHVFGNLVMSGIKGCEESIIPLLESSRKDFDFIMCDAIFAFPKDRWKEIGIPKAVLLEDLHGSNPAQQVQLCLEHEINTVFHRYNLALEDSHPDLIKSGCRRIWFPHCVDTDMFRDHGTKSLGALMVGVTAPQYYPTRSKAVSLLKDKPYFKHVERPAETPHLEKKYPVGKDYAALLSSAKLSITGGSIYHYPVMKYFEIPASNTLLVSDWFPELGLLGFEPEKNMVVADLDNLSQQVEWWLSHDEERERVSQNGYEFIRKYHRVDIRAKQLVNHFCEILGKEKLFTNEL